MKRPLRILLAFCLILLQSMFPQNNSYFIKGRLKRIDHYLSSTHTDYFYDNKGRMSRIEEPYGAKEVYTYYENLAFREWTDRYQRVRYDTIIYKSADRMDSIIGKKYFDKFTYDEVGNRIEESYMRTRGKNKRPVKEYRYLYDYYDKEIDTVNADFLRENPWGRKLLKRVIGVEQNGDTTYWFTFSYRFDTTGYMIGRNEYYRTGQLYDSVGYSYY
jgi:hypothetical protein